MDAQTRGRIGRVFRTVQARDGVLSPSGVKTVCTLFADLARERRLPPADEILEVARECKVAEADLAKLDGVILAARHGQPDIGRLRGHAPPSSHFACLTRDETFAVRQALFLLLYGPFCNMTRHPGGGSKTDTHALTGFTVSEFRLLMAALDAALSVADSGRAEEDLP